MFTPNNETTDEKQQAAMAPETAGAVVEISKSWKANGGLSATENARTALGGIRIQTLEWEFDHG